MQSICSQHLARCGTFTFPAASSLHCSSYAAADAHFAAAEAFRWRKGDDLGVGRRLLTAARLEARARLSPDVGDISSRQMPV